MAIGRDVVLVTSAVKLFMRTSVWIAHQACGQGRSWSLETPHEPSSPNKHTTHTTLQYYV